MNNGSGTVLEHDAQIPHESFMGGIVDSHGDAVRRKPNLIERADRNMSEKVELTKGMLWLLGAGVVILNLSVSYGGTLVGWAREDQSQKEQLTQIQTNLKSMSETFERMDDRFKDIDGRLREQERLSDRISGFKAGVAEAQSDKK